MNKKSFANLFRAAHLRTFSDGGQICHGGNKFSGVARLVQEEELSQKISNLKGELSLIVLYYYQLTMNLLLYGMVEFLWLNNLVGRIVYQM